MIIIILILLSLVIFFVYKYYRRKKLIYLYGDKVGNICWNCIYSYRGRFSYRCLRHSINTSSHRSCNKFSPSTKELKEIERDIRIQNIKKDIEYK